MKGYRNNRERDGWWPILISGLLERVIQCSIHLGMHERILEASFEIIGLESAQAPKMVWMETFLRSLKNIGSFGVSSVSVSNNQLNDSAMSPLPPISIDMTSLGIETLYGITACFESDETPVGSWASLQLVVHSKAPKPLYPLQIVLEFTNGDCNRSLFSHNPPVDLQGETMGETRPFDTNFFLKYTPNCGSSDECDNNYSGHLMSYEGLSAVQFDSKTLVIHPNCSNVFEVPIEVGSVNGLLVCTGVTFVFGAFGHESGRKVHFSHRFPVVSDGAMAVDSYPGWWLGNESKRKNGSYLRTLPNSIQ